MSHNTTLTGQRWVAFGAAGALGSIHRTADGYRLRLLDDSADREFPSLAAAKGALLATLPAGSEWPEFREH